MPLPVNKTAVAAAFGRAASGYDKHAHFQRESGQQLIAMLGDISPSQVLDAGCGTGWFSRYWSQRGADVTGLDLSVAMLEQASLQSPAIEFLCGDIEALPLPDACVDLAWSNLAIQWCADLRQALSELCRVTRPGGHVAFTTLAAGSLCELHQAWQAVDQHSHGNHFLSRQAIDDACRGWQCQINTVTVRERWVDVLSAMRSLKGIGATHLHAGRASTTLTRQQLQALSLAWPQEAGEYLLSYQLIVGVITRE